MCIRINIQGRKEPSMKTPMKAMFLKLLLLSLLFLCSVSSAQEVGFVYNGFTPHNLTLTGIAELTPNGLLALTNGTVQKIGHAFYPNPITFKKSANDSVFSFSTTFVFGIIPEYPTLSGHGIAFVVAPQKDLPGALPSQYLGLFNESNNGNDTNHVFAVELDTIKSTEFQDINENHVGIDINSLISSNSTTAGFYSPTGSSFTNLSLISARPMQLWIDYDGAKKQISVALAPFRVPKPRKPLLTLSNDLSAILGEKMYVGFSSSTGSVVTSHYVLGWSFSVNGVAEALSLSKLPRLPRVGKKPVSKILTIGVPIISAFLIGLVIWAITYYIRRKRKFAEIVEDWEREYGPHRFKFKDLYIATKGFKDQELLGAGGFGRVYRGLLPTSKIEVAVKRVSHESRQGVREFVAEIISIGRLRHRNIATLLGYCRRKGELLLVYDYMPNGSLDKYLYNQPKVTLTWSQRFRVIKGVASGLLYLHEGWEQIVIHRDVKASNVLLDGELNARLGDFGLSRLYDHGTDPQTTHVVGTLGYLAPEHTRTGKATKATDVFAFGAFILEVVTGRRPIEARGGEDVILVDWVFSFWNRGEIMDARDPKLGDEFVAEEVELGLKLGLVCSHAEPNARPTIRQVLQYLEGDMPLKELSSLGITSSGLTFAYREGFDDYAMSYPSSMDQTRFSITTSSIAESHLSSGR